MNWKRLSAFIVSIVLLLPFEQWVQACAGDWDPFDEYPSFFLNTVTNTPAYRPFYYTSSLSYYDLWDNEDELNFSHSCSNIVEWQQYSDKSLPLGDIDSFVYGYSYNEVASLYQHIEKGTQLNMSKEATKNAFTKWFIKNKDKEALGYLMYAKECEPHVQPVDGHYDNKTYDWIADKRDVAKMNKLKKNGLQLLAAAKDKSIKLRYAYQVIRLALYSENYQEAIKLYDELVPGNESTSIIYARCFGLKAGALYKMGRKDEAAYLYSKLFDMRNELKRQSFLSFDWSTNGKVDGALTFCKNDHERAVIYVMRGLHIYSQDDEALIWMQKAYSADPTVAGLDVVMTREINKVEGSYGEITGTDGVGKNNEPYLVKLQAFAKKNADDPKSGSRAFWLLSASYLYYIQGDLAQCKSYMDIAVKEKMSDKETEQHEIIGTLYIIGKSGKINEQTEEELLPRLEKIEAMAMKDDRYKKVYRDMLTTVIAPMYIAQRDTVKGLYAYERANREALGGYGTWYSFDDKAGSFLEAMSIDKLHEVQKYAGNKKAGKFDKWLIEGTGYSLGKLKELEGTKYLRKHEFEKAVATLKEVPEEMMITLPDAFVQHTDDYHEQYAEDSTHMYDKLTFAKEMLQLQKTILKDPKDANATFRFATGLYSMTYYGKADDVYTYYRSSSDNDAYYMAVDRQKMPLDLQDFYGAISAEKYYMQAFGNTTDKELRARCLFMAAKCWQKRCPLPPGETNAYAYWGSGNDVYFLNAITSPYLKQLVGEYKGTEYYNEAYNTCAYLRAYVIRN